jgi:SsrA-binding protein
VPLSFYLKHGIIKLELGVCRGKKTVDKREVIKQREQKRDAERAIRERF